MIIYYTAAGKKLSIIKLETNTVLKGTLNFRKQMLSHVRSVLDSNIQHLEEVNIQSNRNAGTYI